MHKGFSQRFGFFSLDLKEKLKIKNNIWLHAVSVGEVKAASQLLSLLKEQFPLNRIIISTVTPTGNILARSFLKNDDLAIYFPLDLSFIVDKFIKNINPKIFITTETEIWPNLFLALQKKGIPIILINGRISDRSFQGYKIIRLILKRILKSVVLFCMQTKLDAERIRQLGARQERIIVTGNIKFDLLSSTAKYQLADFGLKNSDLLFIAGSTHKGEEKIIIKVYKNLSREFSNLKLLIAPRHIERCGEIEAIFKRYGIKYLRFSCALHKSITADAVILDTIGDLNSLYALADVVFMGGSLIKKGGQNIIEPALFGKSIIFGPYMFNFKDITQLFLNKKAALKINNREELEMSVRKILLDKGLREKIGLLAKEIVKENRGATEKTAALIKEKLS